MKNWKPLTIKVPEYIYNGYYFVKEKKKLKGWKIIENGINASGAEYHSSQNDVNFLYWLGYWVLTGAEPPKTQQKEGGISDPHLAFG